jgi:hypothetical protein
MAVVDYGVGVQWVQFLSDVVQKDPSMVGPVWVVLVQSVVAVAVVGGRRN